MSSSPAPGSPAGNSSMKKWAPSCSLNIDGILLRESNKQRVKWMNNVMNRLEEIFP
jgi:hypothetical protein